MGYVYNNPGLNCGEWEKELGLQEISVSDDAKGLEHTRNMSDSFVVDMEHFPHLVEKDMINANSRIKRNLSRKVSTVRGGDNNNKFNTTLLTTSPTATTSHGNTTPENPTLVTLGPPDHSTTPQVHHQITITNGTTATAESKLTGRKYSFRRRSDSWAINPRRILLFFATLSSIGTILLIYFTLSMSKLNEDDNALDE